MDNICNIDDDWVNFCEGVETFEDDDDTINRSKEEVYHHEYEEILPKCGSLYISTQTKISYLSHKINLAEVFWKVPVMPYQIPKVGVVKKQMKFNSTCHKELQTINENIQTTCCTETQHIEQYVMTHIENPTGRVKFKDVRKISIGLCKKDILSNRSKKKSAFYNCFVVILRVKSNDKFKEINVKVFNTGKLEIPGIQTDDLLVEVLNLLTSMLSKIVDIPDKLTYLSGKCETVLINSNFNCGYYINRDKMYDLLKYKYNINCSYDPCSYPGIQCEFHYDPEIEFQTGQQPRDISKRTNLYKVSFMIFRTGSVLIVGKCTETILNEIYTFVRSILETEYKNVGLKLVDSSEKTHTKSEKGKKLKIIKINI